MSERNSVGVSAFIKEQLQNLDGGSAIVMSNLVKELMVKFPTVKTKTGASARVNLVLKQKKIIEDFEKIKGKDKKTYIVRRGSTAVEQTETVATDEGLGQVADGGSPSVVEEKLESSTPQVPEGGVDTP